MTPPNPVRYSFVIPIFNEEAVLPILLRRIDTLMAQLDGPAEAGSREILTIAAQEEFVQPSRRFEAERI